MDSEKELIDLLSKEIAMQIDGEIIKSILGKGSRLDKIKKVVNRIKQLETKIININE